MIDLRDQVDELKKRGELLTVAKEMDVDLDAAALAAMSNRKGAQAIHFTKLAGYPEGETVAANVLSGPGHYYFEEFKRQLWGRMALAMGLDPMIDYESLISTINERYTHPIMPIKVAVSPCKDVVKTGDDVNLFEFPFPLLHKEDGGRYGSGILMVKDPDSDWQNWGVYRFMIASRNEIVADFLTEPALSVDARAIYRKYVGARKPMPFAIALGGAPAITMAAALKVPPGISEVDIAGGLNLDPINLVAAETSELMVPGDAEIVIEGNVIPGEMAEEGPYGSIKGYTEHQSRPLMKVTAITHRKDPIVPIIVDGTKVSDTQAIISIMEASRIQRVCIDEHQDPLRWVQIPPDWNLSVGLGSVMNVAQGVVFRFARYVFAIENLFDKLIVVDMDVMPKNLFTVVGTDWVQKCHPLRDQHVLDNYPKAVMPNYGEIEGCKGMPRLYIDACWPAWYKPEERPTPITFESSYPKELRERTMKRWKEEFKFPVAPVIFPEGQR